MKLQGRSLSSQMSGEDVKSLHGDLLRLGFALSDDEVVKSHFGADTRRAVLEFQRRFGHTENAVVDAAVAESITREAGRQPRVKPFVVKGVVLHPNGSPFAGGLARAFDRDLRSEQLLGESATDASGRYEIRYGSEQFRRTDKAGADLAVKVFDRDQRPVHEPGVDEILFNAPPTAVVDIRLKTGDTRSPSEYERLVDDVRPLSEGVALAELRETDETRDVTFLHRETGWPVERLEHLVVAHRLAAESGVAPEFFYALLREDTLLKIDLASASRVRFHVGLRTETKPLLFDVVLLKPEVVREAVARAVASNYVPAKLGASLEDIIAALARRGQEAETFARTEQPRKIFRLIEKNIAAGKHEEVLGILRDGALGDLPRMLRRLSEVSFFAGDEEADSALASVGLGELFGFDEELVERAKKARDIKRPEDVRKLAALSPSDWKAVLAKPDAGRRAAASPEGQGVVEMHASALARKMERRFPTAAFAAQLARRKEGGTFGRPAALAKVLEDNPELDLTSTNLNAFFRSKGAAAGDGDWREAAEVKDSLKAVQRVFKLAPTFRKTDALMSEGVRSAADVTALGETQFVKRFADGETFTEEEARAAFRKAADVHTASALLAAELRSTAGAAEVHALSAALTAGDIEAVAEDFPNLGTLFQLTDLCECLHCRSVYSPAAYMVEALQFLQNRLVIDTTAATPSSVRIAKDVLFERRPDLGDIDLSCENTNTPLPYIDVVCELLEEFVAPDAGVSFAGAVAPGIIDASLADALRAGGLPFTDEAVVHDADLRGNFVVRDEKVVAKAVPEGAGQWRVKRLRQTHLSAAELAAAPEYVNTDAYDALRLSRFAFRLPFDLYHQETRGYFEQFGVRRADLMRALQTPAGPPDRDIAADAFGLSGEERALVCDAAATPDAQQNFWNTGATPAPDALRVVDTFLDKSGMTYAELAALLELEFINPGGGVFIRHLDDTCDTRQKHLDNLDLDALDRLHRFIRLWRATGLDVKTLDRAVMAERLGGGDLDDDFLKGLARVVELSQLLGLSVDDLIIFYGTIPAAGDDSRYARLFLNKAANGFVDEAFAPENVRRNESDEAAAAGTGKKLSLFRQYLALSLGATRDDIDRVVGSLGPDAILSFGNIAAVYSATRLAKALGLSAADFLTLRELTGSDVFASPDDTLGFVEKVGKVKAAGVRADDLRYLLRHEAEDLSARAIGDEAVAAFLAALRDGYQAAFAATRSPFNPESNADENKGFVKELLAKLPNFSEAELSKFQSFVEGDFTDASMTAAQFIDSKLAAFLDTTQIKADEAALAAAPPAGREAARMTLIRTVLDSLSALFFRRAQEAHLSSTVASTFKTGEEVTGVVLRRARLKFPAAAGEETLLRLLTTDALVDKVNTPPQPPAVTPAAFANQYRATRLLHKMAQLLAALTPRADELEWMLLHNAELGWLEPDALPYEAGVPRAGFERWERLNDARGLSATYPPVASGDSRPPLSFYTLFETVLQPSATTEGIVALLSELTGWDAAVLADLDARFALSAADLDGSAATAFDAYRLPETYARLGKAVALLRRLGLGVDAAAELTEPTLDADDAQAARQALKARYEEAQWLGVLKGIQDKLRERKRDALVAYLLALNPDIGGSNDLFDFFLIDVEMSACQPTSRIVQAHGTLQLFVQRCLMGLEPRAVADVKQDGGWEQWQWMKNYRVWEANRKVFLYPENWIEPDLRDDKSPLFRDLESALLQNELDDRAAEDAAAEYLEKLDEIALLEVMAVYYQTDIYTMHVFARTRSGDPSAYYHRRFEKERYWTPWEKVDLDITGDHLMAFVRNGRLYLAWPVFSEEPNEEQSIKIPGANDIPATGGKEADKPQKRWKVQLAVGEFSGRKWLPKKVSKDGLRTRYYETLPAREDFRFVVVDLQSAGTLIACTYLDNGRAVGGEAGDGDQRLLGVFTLTGCGGYPEPLRIETRFSSFRFLPLFRDTGFKNMRYRELGRDAAEDLSMLTVFNLAEFLPLLMNTPGNAFKVTYPHQMSLIDILLFVWQWLSGGVESTSLRLSSDSPRGNFVVQLGAFMPFFFGDGVRAYTVLTGFFEKGQPEPGRRPEQRTFSDILKFVEDVIAFLLKWMPLYAAAAPADRETFLAGMKADKEYIRLDAESKLYPTLQPGGKFRNFYHPMVCPLRAALYGGGIPALMKRETQLSGTGFNFDSAYAPAPAILAPRPVEDIDFDPDGSYAGYNWELFFHLPFLVAAKLTREQRFEESMKWFHYIFNPVGASDGAVPQKYWVTKPFFQTTAAEYTRQRIDQILKGIAEDPTGASLAGLKQAVEEWRAKPFKPHVIARSRPVAYQKAVLMKYIDNLIEWGDNLFRQDTMESVNQATQLYVLADKLLGEKPRTVPPAVKPPPETYNQLESKVDLFGNALLELENVIPDLGLPPHGGAEPPAPPLTLSSLYFCIPQNDRMLEYWDRVADRLFKIRHCRNIEGVERALALFAPPIDPAMLVRAAAAGLDVSAVLGGLSAPTPLYRFSVMAQKATELTQQVGSLGAALLQTLEKKDAEALSLLRSEQELRVLGAVRAVKEQQIREAAETVEGLRRSRAVVEERRGYYDAQERMNTWEKAAVAASGVSLALEAGIALGYVLSGGLKLVPQFLIGAAGFGGTPTADVETGGRSFGDSAEDAVKTLSAIAAAAEKTASMLATQGGYQRREEEWRFQVRLADRELLQLDKQIAAAEIRREMAEKELANHDLQIRNARQADEFMRGKFTNRELYDWMVGQISSVYFRAYQLAFDAARNAERCFRHELGSTSTFLQFGYWDSLRKGLLAADHLHHDIKRMEVAYLDQNRREYELTKHVSLLQLDPRALSQLKNAGKCTVRLPEALFDLDHPGHYMRRLKSVAVSIPCVTGPYTSVSCKLSLVGNKYRKDTAQRQGQATAHGRYAEDEGNDERFVYNVGSIQSIATSQSQNDTGMFELNFRDERYLHFEGAGAISTWRIEMPSGFRQFDYSTIADVVLHLRYTARDGGSGFRTLAESALRESLNGAALASGGAGLFQAFDFRQEFPNEWYRLRQDGSVTMTIRPDHLPFFTQGHAPALRPTAITWLAALSTATSPYVMSLNGTNFDLSRVNDPNNPLRGLFEGTSGPLTLGTPFTLAAVSDSEMLEGLVLLVGYTVNS